MTSIQTCPRCSQSVDPGMRDCPHCGIDLTLAAILVSEQKVLGPVVVSQGAPLTPEILVPRLGEILLEKKLIDPGDLQRALNHHMRLSAENQPRLLGQILLELGLIDRETLDQVVTEQIFQLQAALQNANLQLEKRVQERTRDLQDALSKLSELNQLKSNFISNISHELRTPLTHIKGYLDLLADGSLGELNEEQQSAIEVMQRSESRLEDLIENLLRFSLVSRGEFTLHKSSVKVADMVATAISRVEKKAQARSIQLKTRLQGNLPPVYVDEEKITWVLLQLLDNAVKFTNHGGRVLICADAEEGGVRLSILDTGIGIPAERIEELFEPFHQLDGSETRRYGGTGLGLALVKRILDAHGTLIKVESVVGKGTRFIFSLRGVKNDHQ